MTTRGRTARRPTAARVVAPRRLTAWDDQVITLTTLASGGTGLQLLLCENVADPEKRGCTLIRIIIGLSFFPTPPGQVSGRQAVSFGIALASDDAFTGGALPDPETDDDYPVSGWLFRTTFPVFDETLATSGPIGYRIERDIRSGRKLDRSSIYMDMHSAGDEGTQFSIGVIGLVRCLYKLP